MQGKIKTIYENNKPINSLSTEEGFYVVKGTYNGDEVLEINPYLENGEMASITWYCVNFKSGAEQRINPKYVMSVGF